MRYQQNLAWSVLLRLFHWSFALSVVVLVTTGFYIHFPWTNTMLEGGRSFPVATMFYIHFIAAFVFTAALLARLYLLLFGNRQERFWDFLPITPKNIANLFKTIANYLYISDKYDRQLGHNTLAGIFYLITFILGLVQVLSGFYMLYPENVVWQTWGLRLLGPMQQARYLHYLIMWYFILFAFIHLYIVVWTDIWHKEGLISSIVNGRKFSPDKN